MLALAISPVLDIQAQEAASPAAAVSPLAPPAPQKSPTAAAEPTSPTSIDAAWAAGDSNRQLDALVTALIEQLGNNNFRVRANAQEALEKIGLPAFEALRGALEHPNIHVARSAEYLLLSQYVIWWLDTDSHEVRERLYDFSSLSSVDRHTRLQQLSLLGSDDALLALCRVAKFESDEWVSRAAALYLLIKLDSLPAERQLNLAISLQLTLQRTSRAATGWLSTYVHQISGAQPMEMEIWTGYAAALNLELTQKKQPQPQERQQVLQFYEFLTQLAGRHQGRQASLELVRPSMRLVAPNSQAIREYCIWLLSVNLPELVVQFATEQAQHFDQDPKLTYLLAEAHLQLGDSLQADQLAGRALHLPENRANLLGQFGRGGAGDTEALQRGMQAQELRERGMFNWAEAEYLEALTIDKVDVRIVAQLREWLSHFYWEGGNFARAADTLQPQIEKEPADNKLPRALYDHAKVVADYHWYRAQQFAAENQIDQALEHYRQALESNLNAEMQNPDIVISLRRMPKSDAQQALFDDHFPRMLNRFRSLVAEEEARMSQSNLGQFASVSQGLAQACNQLAWLLSNCDVHIDEALYLSSRSLEIEPESYAYLDTMARCRFAAGQFAEAVQYQRRALAKSPHDRMLKAQLSQFEAAAAAAIHASTATSDANPATTPLQPQAPANQ
ncbi:MAG: hypothetical protein KF752_13515 [Pirellulaceae bacterium]|nr:hypothetical protein [Pirellulaceae bacterium]